MASAGKKGKKNKGTVISLQSFLANGDAPAGTTQVAKKIRNVDGDESDDGRNSLPLVYQLPTAPRANRAFDDDSIPHKPPFLAYVTNLPFDVSEDDIYTFFGGIAIVSLRLPREDGETGRVRGFGYIEFENRDDLIHVLSLPDPSIKGRRIRIEISNENEQQNSKQRGGRRNFDNFGNREENRDSTNWRRDNQESGGYEKGYSRNSNRDRKPVSEDNGEPGSWRTSNRPSANDSSDRPPNDRHRDHNNRRGGNFDRENRFDEERQQERPKLKLQPRTLPLPEIVTVPEQDSEPEAEVDVEPESDVEKAENSKSAKPTGVAAEKVFGSAKPVDTAAREQEIEERLAEARRLETLRREDDDLSQKVKEVQLDKSEKDNTNSAISWRRKTEPGSSKNESRNSPDRIGYSRQDDRRRENRDRDYNNRFNKNRDRTTRSENIKNTRPTASNKDSKRDDSKSKRDIKVERPLPKYQPNQTGPVLQSSNKYSGLDDEASD